MIPRLFEADWPDTHDSFEGHGLGDLIDATECLAEENCEEGHEFELGFNYPETGELFSEIQENRIVVAKTDDFRDFQAFRIYSISKSLNHMISVSCQHISYDLAGIPVKPFTVENASDALEQIENNKLVELQNDHFIFSTDLPDPEYDPTTDANTLTFEEPQSIRKIFLDGDDSIHGKYGGDIVIDNFDVQLLEIGGEDTDETIEYGIDLVELSQERNIGEMVTGILPYYKKDANDSVNLDLEINESVTEINTSMVKSVKEYTLENGKKYTLSFYTENTGARAYINGYSGFWIDADHQWFDMDGTKKEFTVTRTYTTTYPADTVLVYSGSKDDTIEKFGEIYQVSLKSVPVEPILYGSVAYGPGTYSVQKIVPVDLSAYFSEEPTIAQLNAKAAEYVEKEEIGQPEIDLTVSYVDSSKNLKIHDAVHVKFPRMNLDVKAKITGYKYDVLAERPTEISVGKTKDSLYFTLQDASRLKRGMLPPDRIGKRTITSDKYAKGSVGSDAIGGGAVTDYNIDDYAVDEDKLRDKAINKRKFKVGGTDAVLQSVPDNVYGLYGGDVGYVFDPSLGVEWLQLPGWKDAQGHVIKPVTWHQNIPYDGGSGVGYCLAPEFVLDGSLDARKKVTPQTVTENSF